VNLTMGTFKSIAELWNCAWFSPNFKDRITLILKIGHVST